MQYTERTRIAASNIATDDVTN